MATPTRRDVHVDAPMTNISIAYRNTNYIADQILPIVPVNKITGVYFKFNKAAFFRDEARVRAPGTPSARADYSLDTNGSYVCIEYALSTPVADSLTLSRHPVMAG